MWSKKVFNVYQYNDNTTVLTIHWKCVVQNIGPSRPLLRCAEKELDMQRSFLAQRSNAAAAQRRRRYGKGLIEYWVIRVFFENGSAAQTDKAGFPLLRVRCVGAACFSSQAQRSRNPFSICPFKIERFWQFASGSYVINIINWWKLCIRPMLAYYIEGLVQDWSKSI